MNKIIRVCRHLMTDFPGLAIATFAAILEPPNKLLVSFYFALKTCKLVSSYSSSLSETSCTRQSLLMSSILNP